VQMQHEEDAGLPERAETDAHSTDEERRSPTNSRRSSSSSEVSGNDRAETATGAVVAAPLHLAGQPESPGSSRPGSPENAVRDFGPMPAGDGVNRSPSHAATGPAPGSKAANAAHQQQVRIPLLPPGALCNPLYLFPVLCSAYIDMPWGGGSMQMQVLADEAVQLLDALHRYACGPCGKPCLAASHQDQQRGGGEGFSILGPGECVLTRRGHAIAGMATARRLKMLAARRPWKRRRTPCTTVRATAHPCQTEGRP
jgi:hypothetical protein